MASRWSGPSKRTGLSAALLAAGRPHSVLPCGITHMAAHEQVAGNMLLLQRDFLRDALAGSAISEPERRQ